MGKTFNFRNPDIQEVREMEEEVQKRRVIAANIEKYKAIAALLSGKEALLTTPELVRAANLAFNRENMTFEEYEMLFPEQFEEAKKAATARTSADKRDYNPKSKAKWRNPGFLPTCISELFQKCYSSDDDKKKARKRFWAKYPHLKVRTHK